MSNTTVENTLTLLRPGLKITFEGPRACGKTFVALKVKDWLETSGHKVKHSMGILDTIEIIK